MAPRSPSRPSRPLRHLPLEDKVGGDQEHNAVAEHPPARLHNYNIKLDGISKRVLISIVFLSVHSPPIPSPSLILFWGTAMFN